MNAAGWWTAGRSRNRRRVSDGQGYFATRPAVRVRREAEVGGPCQYIVCFKGKGGLARQEIELPVTEAQYQALTGMLTGP